MRRLILLSALAAAGCDSGPTSRAPVGVWEGADSLRGTVQRNGQTIEARVLETVRVDVDARYAIITATQTGRASMTNGAGVRTDYPISSVGEWRGEWHYVTDEGLEGLWAVVATGGPGYYRASFQTLGAVAPGHIERRVLVGSDTGAVAGDITIRRR